LFAMRYELGFISQKAAFFKVTAVKTSNFPNESNYRIRKTKEVL
jgi:hypothetical protein